jgi:phosphoribosylformylglycinamidine synthase
MEDVHTATQIGFRNAGRAVVLLRATAAGDATDAESEFGSSEYAKEILGALWGYPPELDLEAEAALQKAVVEIIQAGLVESAHDCSEGGLAVTLAESALPAQIGCRVDVASEELAPEFVLFGEDAGRVVVSCDPGQVRRIQEIGVKHGISAKQIGETIPEKFEIGLDGRLVVSANVGELCDIYEGALEKALRTEAEPVAAN